MPRIDWQHNRERLLLPIVVMPGYNSSNPMQTMRTEGLLDTGATGTGIRADIATYRPRGLEPRRTWRRERAELSGHGRAPALATRSWACGDLLARVVPWLDANVVIQRAARFPAGDDA